METLVKSVQMEESKYEMDNNQSKGWMELEVEVSQGYIMKGLVCCNELATNLVDI